jgi:hypothetical protein
MIGDAPQLSALVLSLRDPHGAEIPGEFFASELLLKSICRRTVSRHAGQLDEK